MDFNEVLAQVIGITARPDKVIEATVAINAAVSKCSVRASFARDLVETSISINNNLYGDTIQFNNVTPTPLVTRFRKFKYVKPTGALYYLKPIGADQVFTPSFNMQRNRYYVGGNNITYTLSSLANSLEIGYYQYPITLDAATNTTHWILDLMPYVIIDLACARIFKGIGDDSSARMHMLSGEEDFKIHRNDYEDSILIGAQ